MGFSALPEAEKVKSVEAGCPVVLHCTLSDPTAQVGWYKDGTQLFSNSGIDIQSEDNVRTFVLQSAEPSHSGTYSCISEDDSVEFRVEIQGDFTLSAFVVCNVRFNPPSLCLLRVTNNPCCFCVQFCESLKCLKFFAVWVCNFVVCSKSLLALQNIYSNDSNQS